MNSRCALSRLLAVLGALVLSHAARAADWPAHRYDATRSAASPEALPAELHSHWVRQLPPLRPAWPDQAMMQFDAAYAPVVAGKLLFVASPLADTVTAYHTETGAEKWRFTADGPIRFSPFAWEDRLFFVSDDGHLYCLEAASGKLVWKFRGGPADRHILGNARLISMWPARGGPVVADGTVYFAASIWPFMGVFIHALDARTGKVRWTNDGDGSTFMKQPHQADSFAAVAPQGNLVEPDVRLAQGNADATAIGSVTRDALRKSGQWDALSARTAVFKMTVNDVANDVQVGAADAGIVWDSTVRQTAGLEAVALPQFAGVRAHISATVLRSTARPTDALKFARFLAARDRGLPQFATHGFDPVEGDVWAEEPELKLLAGAMLRPAVEETITAFEKREGVKVTRVYNGCGILVAQMKAGERPDAYFACDKSFMDDVADLFTDHSDVSTNQLVILVHKGNPHGIKTLLDLGKPGLRVGIGHEKQCAMGVLTQRTFKEGGVQEQVMKNVKVQVPTGDMLVNQMRTGSLDAAVAYVSNAVPAAEQLEAIAINIPCAIAVQPVAAGKDSKHKQLTNRLTEALRSAESRSRFEANGFHWLQVKK